MRRIREAHNLTINDLHDETKIPIGLIEAFEERALFDHPQFNRVYLRSFVRTYAQVVGVDSEHALDALEEALAGHYAGSLAADYLGEVPEEETPPAGAEVETEAETAEPEGPAAEATPPPEKKPPHRPEMPREETAPEVPEEEAAAEEPPPSVEAPKQKQPPRETDERRLDREAAERETEKKSAAAPLVSTSAETSAAYEAQQEGDEDWSTQSPPSGTRRATTTPRSRRDGLDRRWVIGGLLAAAVAVVAWILISVLGGTNGGTTSPVATGDTVQDADTAAAQPRAVPSQPVDLPTLGDSIAVQIIAARGKVDPIRVTIDDDLRRPYWIEQGDSMVFQPTQRIVVEELLDSIDVKVEGIPYPTDVRDDQGRIVITRDSVQSHFASLQGAQ